MADNTNREKLNDLLREMFQFDQADLDFGIYRIMALKRNEIETFLNEGLLKTIDEGLNDLRHLDVEEQIKQIDEEIKFIKNIDLSEEIKTQQIEEKEKKRKELSKSINAFEAENEICNHLINFFSRYYDEGDFISQRRYKDGVYAIPYEGEEVKLHWANADQYYIKTSEYFKDYTFKTTSGNVIHFKILEAETEKDNNKSNKNRTFVLCEEKSTEIISGELFIYMQYFDDGTKIKQKQRNTETVGKLSEIIKPSNEYSGFYEILVESDNGNSELEKQLNRYTARNTFDYFIHKDLKKFLNRELDFYIKNEVIHIDDIETQYVEKTQAYIIKSKALRSVAKKIIEFLAQIEDFQKTLFLKKKFVVDTNYCITLDRVPESFYEEIATNDNQRDEWVKLFAIDEIEADLAFHTEKYSEPLTVAFLKENKNLLLDTKFFSDDFKERLISEIDDLDEKIDGLLIHGENFQALNFLQRKYGGKIDCIYIDPPYNTEKDREQGKFIYKDNFAHSSWLSLMNDRLLLSKEYFKDNGVIFISIDDAEQERIKSLCSSIFWKENFVGQLIIQTATDNNPTQICTEHEYMLCYAKNKNNLGKWSRKSVGAEKIVAQYEELKSKFSDTQEIQEKLRNWIKNNKDDLSQVIHYDKVDKNGVYSSSSNSSNTKPGGYTFDIIHPVTKKPCPKPEYGWRWKEETFWDYANRGDVEWGIDETTQPHIKKRIETATEQLSSIIYEDGRKSTKQLENLFGKKKVFDNPKPVDVISRILEFATSKSSNSQLFLDFFAGSGTTAHAVINLNREIKENGLRKYILCEMGEYFDTVTKPRIQKAVYASDWKNGKPVTRDGISHIFKYITLESYEDTLNNIEFENHGEQNPALNFDSDKYFLSYMLKNETKESPCLLNIDDFKNPFDYKMGITQNLEKKECTIDFVETFNYLLGLKVICSNAKTSFDATFNTGEHGMLFAELKSGNKYKFKTVEGVQNNGAKVLVIWRNLTDDQTKDNAVLDAYFSKIQGEYTDFDFAKVYVNGDNNLTGSETLKVLFTEAEMKRLMFKV